MTRHWPHAAVALAAVVAAFLWPLTAALPSREVLQARIAAAILAVLVCALLASWQTLRGRTALAISVVSALVGLTLLLDHFSALDACIVDYSGQPRIVGTEFSEDAQTYLRDNPGVSPAEQLLDVGGLPEAIWTSASIQRCRLRVSWAGLAAVPLLALSAGALIPVRRHLLLARPGTAPVAAGVTPAQPIYDAFMSYRHLEPDRSIAFELVETLEAGGFRVAIDARDFSPNEHFLSEMERCIKQSRFVLCIITGQYVLSEHTSEEAIISKTLDLAERRKRLVPLIFEPVELPVWLHGLVGIDFTADAGFDPRERLTQLLFPPAHHRG